MSYDNYFNMYRKLINENLYSRSIKYILKFTNWKSILFDIIFKKYPIKMIYKSGDYFIANDSIEAYYSTYAHDYEIKIDETGNLIFKYQEKYLQFQGWKQSSINEIYFKNFYDVLNVAGKTVVDIGSSIGDSTVYFKLMGADKVIALEPFPSAYNFAKTNVTHNNIKNVVLINAACSSKNDTLIIDPTIDANPGNKAFNMKTGIPVPTITLEDIVKKYNILQGVLKMDCEGCEYESIPHAKDDTLMSFDKIYIEYHNGLDEIKSRLTSIGFSVYASKPRYIYNKNIKKIAGVGILIAEKGRI